MQLQVAFTADNSIYKQMVEALFSTKLTEADGSFIYNKERKIQEGIIFKDPRRTLKESIAPPQTIVFLIDLAKDIAIGTASGIIANILYDKLKNCLWLKIGNQSPKLTLEDIRKVVQEELEKLRNKDDSEKT